MVMRCPTVLCPEAPRMIVQGDSLIVVFTAGALRRPGLYPNSGEVDRVVTSGPRSSPDILGIQSSQEGMYQFQSPNSFMVAGRRTTRMTVASINTATPRPRPNCWSPNTLLVANAPNTPTIIAAALVIWPAVILIP